MKRLGGEPSTQGEGQGLGQRRGCLCPGLSQERVIL